MTIRQELDARRFDTMKRRSHPLPSYYSHRAQQMSRLVRCLDRIARILETRPALGWFAWLIAKKDIA